MRVTTLVAILLAVSSTPVRAQAPATQDPSQWNPVQITWDQKIPMRDGVKLSATLYRDPSVRKPLPVILTMTPYIAEHAAKQGVYLAQNGYVFVSIDSRGRGNSDGKFVPGQVEARDGYDAIEWAARQPWSDGQVATWGGSWLGFTQWSIAKEFPPHLKAMAPSAAVYPGVDYPQASGIFSTYVLQWLTFVHGRAVNTGIFQASTFWNHASWQQVATGRAFQDLEDITGVKGTVFRTWLAHPREDAFWQAITPRAADYARINLPILTITGHYDGDQRGALTYYDRHMANGSKEARARHWLVIGPWDHSGTRRPKPELGGVTFGPSAVMSMEELHKAWYDHVLKGGPVPEFLKDRVTCFVMGTNTWIHAPDLKQIEGPALTLDLDATGATVGDVTRSGTLAGHAPAERAAITLTSDPRFLPPREEVDSENPDFLKDQKDAYANRESQAIWHSARFPAETVLAGRPRLRLQIATDQPDADLAVSLHEVLPDGSAIFLTSTSIRLRYRKGGVAAIAMVPGAPELVEFPPLEFFARSIAKGSRIRLVVDGAPQFGAQRNNNTGGDLASEPASASRVAHITVMTGPGSGSQLILPRPETTTGGT